MPFEIGFGRETLGERFLLMIPSKEARPDTGLELGRSLGPLANLVKRIIGWEDPTDREKLNKEGMVLD
jgi:hypothetical protein